VNHKSLDFLLNSCFEELVIILLDSKTSLKDQNSTKKEISIAKSNQKKSSSDQIKEILQEAEEELGIIFPPSYINLMQVKSISLKECISGSACSEDSKLIKATIIKKVDQDELETKKQILEKSQEIGKGNLLTHERSKSKDRMLKELRDFIVEKNKINVEYEEKNVPWSNKKIPLETNHNITAVRFEKKEVGDIISM
jgi:hypothetical protein